MATLVAASASLAEDAISVAGKKHIINMDSPTQPSASSAQKRARDAAGVDETDTNAAERLSGERRSMEGIEDHDKVHDEEGERAPSENEEFHDAEQAPEQDVSCPIKPRLTQANKSPGSSKKANAEDKRKRIEAAAQKRQEESDIAARMRLGEEQMAAAALKIAALTPKHATAGGTPAAKMNDDKGQDGRRTGLRSDEKAHRDKASYSARYDKLYESYIMLRFSPTEAAARAKAEADKPEEASLQLILNQTGVKFSTQIFDEDFQDKLEAKIQRVLSQNGIKSGATAQPYCAYGTDDRKHTALSVVFEKEAAAAHFREGIFAHGGVSFEVMELEGWLSKVMQTRKVGFRFAASFGPFPFMPDEDTLTLYKYALTDTYGDITNHVFYRDRTMTVGFALGDRPSMAKCKIGLPIMNKNGVIIASLHPIHQIHLLGVENCKTCVGIGEFHTDQCDINKKNEVRLQQQKKKIFAAVGSMANKPTQPEKKPHQGKRGTGRSAAVISKVHGDTEA